jgi:hypothetical protein
MADFINTMWCKKCQQDVPAIASSVERKYCCPRCGEAVGGQASSTMETKQSPSDSVSDAAHASEIPSYDSWELDNQLWQLGQALQIDTNRNRSEGKDFQHEIARLDSAHNCISPRHSPPKPTSRKRKIKSRLATKSSVLLGFLIWAVLSLGTAALVCGGILLGWSMMAARNELWEIGLPIAIGGQVSLLIGLVLQLNVFWHSNKNTRDKLDEVDEKLHDLKKTASRLGAVHRPSSTSFNTHMVGRANPQLLLSDLKSQLDLLERQIGEQEAGE